ncbi:hypothetical protein CEXT_212611, partial [Caerostris extrusa]
GLPNGRITPFEYRDGVCLSLVTRLAGAWHSPSTYLVGLNVTIFDQKVLEFPQLLELGQKEGIAESDMIERELVPHCFHQLDSEIKKLIGSNQFGYLLNLLCMTPSDGDGFYTRFIKFKSC